MAEKIRIGVIGAGRWGPNLIRNFHFNPGSEVVAVADKSRERLDLLKRHYAGVAMADTAESLLADRSIDAVVICTPTATHFDLAQKALERGKHVFVEKPLATTAAECDQLIKLAAKAQRLLFVGHVFVYNAGIQAVRDLICSGELGKLHHLQITRTNLGPVRSDVSALWDLASHDLSILNFWCSDPPARVSAVGGRFLNAGIEDTVFATYTFPDGVLANIHVSWLNPKKVREITIVGSKKMLVWDDMNIHRPVKIYDKNVTIDKLAADQSGSSIVDTFVGFRASIHEGQTVIPKIEVNEPLAAECLAFLRACKDPSVSLSGGLDGKRVVQALVATDRSLRENGHEIEIQY